MKILAIARGETFSPNLVDNDARILAAVADELRRRGHQVSTVNEMSLVEPEETPDAIINMCRHPRSIALLHRLESRGARVINAPEGIENCNRERLTRLLLENRVPHPDSLIVSTSEPVEEALSRGDYGECWVKRADSQTMSKADVCFCRSGAEVSLALDDFHRRGIDRAVISKHLSGDLIKFYGVEGTEFFHYFYPLDKGHSKFGYEEINGRSRGLKFSEENLRAVCSEAARTLGVRVYGGDAVIAPDGSLKLIDFNDWPSFSPCRDEAARAIANITENLR